MIYFYDNTIMPYGQHKGKYLIEVPADYLLFLYNNTIMPEPLINYIKGNYEALHKRRRRENKIFRRLVKKFLKFDIPLTKQMIGYLRAKELRTVRAKRNVNYRLLRSWVILHPPVKIECSMISTPTSHN